MTTAAEKDFVSIGQLAAHLQRPVRNIEQAAAVLKLRPAMRLNFVPYFSGRQVQRLTKQLNRIKQKETER